MAPVLLRNRSRNILKYAVRSTISRCSSGGGSKTVSRYNNINCSKISRRRLLSSQSTSSSSNGDSKDMPGNHSNSTSNETIEGVWMFHRHGDRTPARSIVADHMRNTEAAYWETKIPPIDRSYYEALSQRFPVRFQKRRREGGGNINDDDDDDDDVDVDDDNEVEEEDGFLDAGKEPYGFLTWKGMDQMYNVGKQIQTRYARLKTNTIVKEGHTKSTDFLDRWDMQVYSTRYLRTVMSVQCFLHGLTDANTGGKSDHQTATADYENPSISSNTCTPFYQNTTPETIRSGHPPPSSPNDHDLHIQVRHRSNDTLNSFDRNPTLMKSLVQNVIQKPSFLTTDARAATLAARLAKYLPGLGTTASYGGPSGINWIHAVDHFVCRQSHGLRMMEFSVHEGAEGAEDVMEAMGGATLTHLTWRFRQWYRSGRLLAAIAGPALGELGGQIRDAARFGIGGDAGDDAGVGGARPPFVVYSCHDVTILGLLYGVGADFVASSEELTEAGILDNFSNSEQRWQFWPKYASTLLFELVRVNKKEDGSDTSADGDGEDCRRIVRILLDGKPVRLMTSLKNNKEKATMTNATTDSDSDAASYEVPLSDFLRLVKELEKQGDFDLNAVGDDGDGNGDGKQHKKGRGDRVSTWTG